ncbi:MAG: glutathione S-transferase family protein [Sedimentitalea sp.]|nr:glutathione S-transferase family protein [Sedimentitalea sp.]
MIRPVLHGFAPSVYTRVARLVLAEKRIPHDYVEVNPFDPGRDPGLLALHPFARVPVLVHGDFVLHETAAIARYLDSFPGPALTPAEPRAAARMAQVTGIVDAYGYWPLVRQVYAQRVVRPSEGLTPDETEIATGLAAAAPVLATLDRIAAEGLVLSGAALTLADCHLAPMIGAFASAPEGAEALSRHPALARWWGAMVKRRSVVATAPDHGASPDRKGLTVARPVPERAP